MAWGGPGCIPPGEGKGGEGRGGETVKASLRDSLGWLVEFIAKFLQFQPPRGPPPGIEDTSRW